MSKDRLSIIGLLLASALVCPAQVTFTEYQLPPAASGYPAAPSRIAVGQDGNLWFTEANGRIGRITPAGVVTEFPIPPSTRSPVGITAGPDGNMWFAESGNGPGNIRIGKIDLTGLITEFPANVGGGFDITAGPDGNLWFTEATNIGRMTPAGVQNGEFNSQIPSIYSVPNHICVGPDGSLWFTEGQFGGIGKITTAGVITKYEPPRGGNTNTSAITAGSDGYVWYIDKDGGVETVKRITTDGAITLFRFPPNMGANELTVGPDGNLWFTGSIYTNDGLGRITPTGAFTFFPDSYAAGASSATGITAAPDGCLWFTEGTFGAVGKISKSCLPGPRVTNVSSTNADGTYGPGSVIAITITFDAAVTVTGTPQLPLNSGGVASYTSGSGTDTLTFTYTVGTGQNALRLDATSFMALAMNLYGATIKDSSSNFAILTLPIAPAVGGLGTNKAITIAPTIPVTINATLSGLSFMTTGTGCQPGSYSTPITLNWATSASCTVEFATPQSGGPGTQYVFTAWDDGAITANPRTIPTPASATTYTANFKTQYQLTTAASPGGAGTVSGAGYYDSGFSAPIVATPSTGYQFLNWTGPVASSSNPSTTVAMSGPQSVTANFQLITTTTVAPVSGQYTDTITLSATVGPTTAVFTGNLQFQVDGVNVGSAVPVTGAGTYTTSYTIDKAAGTYAITATLTSTTSTVAGSSGSNTLTVSRATPAITWPAPSAITYGSVLSAAQLNATASVAGSFAYTPVAGTVLVAGNGQSLSVTFTPTDTAHYNSATATTVINVNKANASVTPNPANKTYGQADPNPLTTGTLAGFLASDNVTATYSRAAGETAGTYTISATLSSAALSNYNITYNTATFTIQPATPGLPPPQTGTATYGVLTTLSVTISAVNGGAVPTGSVTFQFKDTNNTTWYVCTSGAVQTQSCVIPLDNTGKASVTTSNLPVGADNIIATYSGDANYAGGEQTALNFSVSQANTQTMLSLTPNNPAPTYGDTVTLAAQITDNTPNSTGTPTGTVQFAYSTDNGATWTNLGSAVALDATGKGQIQTTALPAPSPKVRASYSGDPNFVAGSVSVTQAVNPKALTVTGITAQDKTYDGTPTATLNTSSQALLGVINSDSVTLSGTATGAFIDANAGASKQVNITSLTLSGTAASNYTLTQPAATASINRAPLTIKADNQSMTYGGVLPTLTYTPIGFVNSETPSVLSGAPSLSSTATSSSWVGPYTITIAQGTLSAVNYSLSFVNGTLIVNKANASVTPAAASKTYGAADPALTGTLTGFLAADNVTATYSRTSGETVAGSPYTISATLSPAGVLGNYNITYITAAFTITKATPILTWSAPAAITYGTALSSTQLNATASMPGSFAYTPAPGQVLPAGASQVLSVSFTPTDASDYTTTVAATTIDVNKAPLTVTANNATRVYLSANPPFTATYSGFVNGDIASVLTGTPSLSTSATASSSPGTYPINIAQGTLSSANYTFSFVNGTLTITPMVTPPYVTNAGSNSVSVINPVTNAVLTTIPVGVSPVHVTLNPTASRAYVTNAGSNSVSVINTSTNTVVATTTVGANPVHAAIAPDGSKLYVANGGHNSVSVFDTATNKVTATIPVGHNPVKVVVSPNGASAYVTNAGSNTVSVLNTATNTVMATISVGANPVDLTLQGNAYVVNTGANSVSVINTSTNTVMATVPVGAQPVSMALTPNGATAYVANAGSSSVSVINTATNSVVGTISIGAIPSHVALTPDGTQAYVTSALAGSVSVIKTSTNAVVRTVHVGLGPTYIEVTPDNTSAYVTNAASNSVSVIHTATNTVTATIPVGTNPVNLAIH